MNENQGISGSNFTFKQVCQVTLAGWLMYPFLADVFNWFFGSAPVMPPYPLRPLILLGALFAQGFDVVVMTAVLVYLYSGAIMICALILGGVIALIARIFGHKQWGEVVAGVAFLFYWGSFAVPILMQKWS